MNTEILKNVSVVGRVAYAVMCIENYLISEYPGKDWTILSEEMWKLTSMYFDDWGYRFIELLPQALFEKPDFASSYFEDISETDYDKFRKLYQNCHDDVNQLLLALYQMEEAFTDESNAMPYLEKITDALERKHISLPNAEKVSFSRISEHHGWGNHFDGRFLSVILKSEKNT